MNNIVPGSFQLMKKINTGLILDTIKLKGPISRADIARLLSLTPATVTNITAELINRNVIVEGELGNSSGGRKPIMLMLNSDAYYVIGIQVDAGMVRTAVLSIETQILEEKTVKFDSNLIDDEIISIIIKSVHEIIGKNSIEKSKILGFGVGVNGIINFISGKIAYSSIFKHENIDLRNILESEFDIPVYIDRDVRAMALCEGWFGEGKEIDTFICINGGSSIRAAIINNKQPIRGISGGLGEIGHMKIADSGTRCSCGNYGCLETFASEQAIIRYACEDVTSCKKDIYEIHKASLNGEKRYIEAIEKAGMYFGIGVANLINAFNPALVIIGGGLININDFYFNSIVKSAQDNSLKQLFMNVKIKRASTQNDTILKGAGLLVFDNLFDTLQ